MTKTPIIISPSGSLASVILSDSADNLYEWYKKIGYQPEYLNGMKARRLKVAWVMRMIQQTDPPPRLMCYYGHGTESSIVGVTEMGFLRRRKFLHLDRIGGFFRPISGEGYIIYTYACSNYDYIADLIENGDAICGFGAKDKLYIGSLDTPFDNDTMDDFVDVTTAVPKALALGMSTYDAFAIFHSKVLKYKNLYVANKSQIENADEFIHAMDMMLENCVVLGRDVKWVNKR